VSSGSSDTAVTGMKPSLCVQTYGIGVLLLVAAVVGTRADAAAADGRGAAHACTHPGSRLHGKGHGCKLECGCEFAAVSCGRACLGIV
jgi:hypothetical protein